MRSYILIAEMQTNTAVIMASPLLVACILIILSLLSLLLSSRRNDKHNLPPGPSNLPIIGNLHRFGLLPHRSLYKLSQKYGPLMYLKLGSVPTIIASSAETAKEFLKTHDLECCSRPLLTPLDKLSYGFRDIVFVPYGEQWRELRKLCNIHLFSLKKVASFRSIREDEVGRMIRSISSQRGEINLSEELMSLANDITCRTALGKRYYGEESDGGRVKGILEETQALFNAFFFADYVPMLGWLDAFTGTRARLEKNFRELDGFYQQVINEHLDPLMRRGDRDEDTIDAMLAMQKKESYITDDHIKGVLMNIFVAGSDTSSALVEWTLTELMRSPEIMRRVQDEVRSVIGNKGKVEESDLDQLHYLKSVLKESLRLHPPVPLLVQRETIQHCKVIGYDVPAKSRLLINALAIGRDGDVWERPDEFYPERFIDSPIDFRGHDFQLIPFGAGRRICPGMHSGMLVAELALANLLCLFDWELPEGVSKEDIDMSESPGITVHRKSGLRLVAKRFVGLNG